MYLKGCLSSSFDDHAGNLDKEPWMKLPSGRERLLADGLGILFTIHRCVLEFTGWPKGQPTRGLTNSSSPTPF